VCVSFTGWGEGEVKPRRGEVPKLEGLGEWVGVVLLLLCEGLDEDGDEGIGEWMNENRDEGLGAEVEKVETTADAFDFRRCFSFRSIEVLFSNVRWSAEADLGSSSETRGLDVSLSSELGNWGRDFGVRKLLRLRRRRAVLLLRPEAPAPGELRMLGDGDVEVSWRESWSEGFSSMSVVELLEMALEEPLLTTRKSCCLTHWKTNTR
jgi:hypothetical protein